MKSGITFKSLRRWVGVVTEYDDMGFHATLTDPLHEQEDIFTHFNKTEITYPSIKIEVGSIFDFQIGYSILDNGQRIKDYLLEFRHDVWTESDKQNLHKRKEEIVDLKD